MNLLINAYLVQNIVEQIEILAYLASTLWGQNFVIIKVALCGTKPLSSTLNINEADIHFPLVSNSEPSATQP